MPVPIVSIQDGPRIMGKMSNFGGKKAAPFSRGGKRALAKALVKKAKRSKAADLAATGADDIMLGTDGAKWSHGWVPLNAEAAAIKVHHGKGGSSPTHNDVVKAMDTAKVGEKYHVSVKGANGVTHHIYTKQASGRWHKGTADEKGMTGLGLLQMIARHENAHAMGIGAAKNMPILHHGFGDRSNSPFKSPDHNASALSDQAKIDNAEKMFGTGSDKHLAALAKFGTESQKRAAAYQVRMKGSAKRSAAVKAATTTLKPENPPAGDHYGRTPEQQAAYNALTMDQKRTYLAARDHLKVDHETAMRTAKVSSSRVEALRASNAAAKRATTNLANAAPTIAKIKSRAALPDSDFVFPEGKRYPIPDKDHARLALQDAKGKSEYPIVLAAVRKRFPNLTK